MITQNTPPQYPEQSKQYLDTPYADQNQYTEENPQYTQKKEDFKNVSISEISIIGAIFQAYLKNDVALISNIFESVKSSDFQLEEHRIIFLEMETFHEKRIAIDPSIIAQKLNERNDNNIQPQFIFAIEEQTKNQIHENFIHHLETIKNYGRLKDLKSAAQKIEALAITEKEADKVLDQSLELIKGIDRASVVKNNKDSVSLLQDLLEDVDYKFQNKDKENPYNTGFTDLDDMSLIEAGDIIVLAGRPSMGKTTLAINICTNWAQKFPVQIISMEMSALNVSQTIVASTAKLDIKKIKTGEVITNDDWVKLNHAICLTKELPIYVNDDAYFNPSKIRTLVEKSVYENGVKAVMIDYFQLISGDKEFFKKDEMYEHIMQELKIMAKELDIVILLLAQVNRECEKRPNKRPIAADLKGSGAIEQDASKIFFVYRDEVYNPDSDDKDTAELISEKNRGGEKNFTVRLQTSLQYGLFQNFSYDTLSQTY